jgi:hypothetical protein
MTATQQRERLQQNLSDVQARIRAACARAARDPATVRLVAVTKYADVGVIRHLLELGVRDLGESRVQQLVERAAVVGPAAAGADATLGRADAATPSAGPRWHMVGSLQRNKVKPLLNHARIVHSLDSLRLAEAIEDHAARLGCTVDALVEVNVAGEATKHGATPDRVESLLDSLGGLAHVRVRGLMTMAPLADDPERVRPLFARLRELREELRCRGRAAPACEHLSMGMSQDYEVAVEEGATLVRIGSALWRGII